MSSLSRSQCGRFR